MAQSIQMESTPQTAEKTTTRTVKNTPKVFKAAISLVLCLALALQMISPELVWAASEAIENASAATDEAVPYQNTILFEDPTLREENKKEYRMSDGSYKAIVYPQPIHYEEYGEWQDIDNTLYLNESAGGYTNAASDFSVTFAKKSDSKKLVEIKTDNYKLSWGFVGSNDNKSAKKKTKVSSDDVTALNNLSDGLYYNNIYNDVDVEYLLQSKTLKENIILKTKNARQSFELELKLNNATAVLNSDRTISIILSDGTEAAKFVAPFMYDAKGVQSQDVAVSLTGSGNKYTLTLTPSKEWLNAEDRAYPVTIDPVLSTDGFTSISCRAMLYDEDNGIYDDTLYIGKYYNSIFNTHDTVYGFIYLFLEDWTNNIIQKVNIKLDAASYGSQMWTGDVYNNVSINKKIAVRAVDHPFSSEAEKESIGKSTPYDVVDVSLNYNSAFDETITYTFDITEYFYDAYIPGSDQFIMFEEYNPPATASTGAMPVHLINPRMEYDYRSPDGVEEYLTYTEASVGEAGTIYINDATGKVVYAHSGLTTPSVTMPISTGLIYQNGKWSTNFSETIRKFIGDEYNRNLIDAGYLYSWIDSDGTEIFFHRNEILNDEGEGTGQYEIVDETGKRIVLTELSNGKVALTDTSKNISLFEPYGENQYRLVSKTDPYGNYINLYYESTTSTKISTLENNYTEIISFVYDDDGRCIGNNEIYSYQEYAQSITYAYDTSGKLVEITRHDGKKTKLSYSGIKLTGVLDVSSGYMVKLIYENNKITLKEYANVPETMDTTDVSEGQSMVMTFNGSSTSFRTPGVNGIMEDGENSDDMLLVCQFDTYLRTVSAYTKSYIGNEFYDAIQQEYTSGGIVFDGNNATNSGDKYGFNKVKSVVGVGKSAENLLANGSFEYSLSPNSPNPADFCGAIFDCNADIMGEIVSAQESDFVYTSIFESMSVDQALAGEKMLSVSITDTGLGFKNAWYAPIARSTTLEPNTEYTFSAYVRRTSSNGLGSRLAVLIGETAHHSSYQHTASTNEWERLEVHFTTPSVLSDDVRFCIESSSSETVFVDCVQLEKGPAANVYNYADNQGFEITYADSANAVNPFFWNGNGTLNTSNTYFGNNAIAVVGDPSANKTVTQTINFTNRYIEPKSRDLTISAWAKADALPNAEHTPDRFFGIRARLVYAEPEGETSYSEIQESSFNYFVSDWQFASLSLSSDETKTLLAVELTLAYNYQTGTCLFDNVSVVDNTVTNYEYDKLGNLTRIKAGHKETTNTYDTFLLKSTVSKNDNVIESIDINEYDLNLRDDAEPTHTISIDTQSYASRAITNTNRINSVTQNIRDQNGKVVYTQTGTELYAYFSFDWGYNDLSPNSNTVVPSPFLEYYPREPESTDHVLQFSGQDCLRIENFIPYDHFSISFDACLDTVANGDYAGQYFVSRYNSDDEEVLGIYNGGGVVTQFGGELSNSNSQVTNTPVNVTITFEKVSEYKTIVRFYINGEYQHSQYIESSLEFDLTDSDWYIGAALDENGYVTNGLEGWIDNLAFFRGVLSESEIALICEGGYFTQEKISECSTWKEYTYSSDGRYLIKEKNSEGKTYNYIIDYKTGITTSVLVTDIVGNTVRKNFLYNPDHTLKLIYTDYDCDGIQDANEPESAYIYDCNGNIVLLDDPDSAGVQRYDRDAARAYAEKWASNQDFSSLVTDYLFSKRNPEYYSYRQNCANFVSQCLYSGGIKMNDEWHMYKRLIIGHKFNPFVIFSTNTWYKWAVSFTWSVVQDQYDYFSNPDNGYILGEVIVISSVEAISEAIETHNIQMGDLLYWSEGSEDELEHSTMISKIEDGMIYYTGNTMTRFDQRLDSALGTDTVYIIRIKDYIEQGEN